MQTHFFRITEDVGLSSPYKVFYIAQRVSDIGKPCPLASFRFFSFLGVVWQGTPRDWGSADVEKR